MLRPMQRDPEGLYARLGLAPTASRAAIVAAYRRQARRLHPDVPGTGSVDAFVALKAAYDVLSDPARRRAYDAAAEPAAAEGAEAWPDPAQPSPYEAPPPPSAPILDRRFMVWIGFLVASAAVAAWLMVMIASGPTSGLSGRPAPLAADTAPADGWTETAALPLARPSGPADHFLLPGLGAATVWQGEPGSGRLRPVGRLPAFTGVHVLGFGPNQRLAAIRLAGGAIGFVEAVRLAAGDQAAARQAFCADRAGPPPENGEVLSRDGGGPGWVAVANRALEPTVVKLRDAAGRVVGSVYLAPGGRAVLRDLPTGPWGVDVGVGELWSRACGIFAAGEQAQRFRFPLGSGSILAIPPDLPPRAMPAEISDQAFAQP